MRLTLAARHRVILDSSLCAMECRSVFKCARPSSPWRAGLCGQVQGILCPVVTPLFPFPRSHFMPQL
jgi:hypothetical protein